MCNTAQIRLGQCNAAGIALTKDMHHLLVWQACSAAAWEMMCLCA